MQLDIVKLYPDNWDYIKSKIKRKYNYTCQKCFKKYPANSSFLDVHHIKSLSKNGSNNEENLILLCKKCHKEFHPHMKRYGEYKPKKKFGNYKKYKLK